MVKEQGILTPQDVYFYLNVLTKCRWFVLNHCELEAVFQPLVVSLKEDDL